MCTFAPEKSEISNIRVERTLIQDVKTLNFNHDTKTI